MGSLFYPQDTSLDISATVMSEDGTEYISAYVDTETTEMIKKYHGSGKPEE